MKHTLLAFLLIITTGCSLTPVQPFGHEYNFISIPECEETKLTNDLIVVQCAGKVKDILTQRHTNARGARTSGGVVQVLTAAISSLVTGVSGANGVTAGTILSGISAIIPEVSEVVDAKGRAEIYADGAKSIGAALAIYRKKIAEQHDGNIDGQRFTPAGAALYRAYDAAISVVKTSLAGLLPSTDDLKAARSETETIEVVPSTLSLKAGDPEATVQVSRGAALTATSNNSPVATVTHTPGSNMAKIKAIQGPYGLAIITFGGSSGGAGTVTVRVEEQPFEVDKRSVNLSLKSKQSETVAAVKGGAFDSITSSDPNVAEATIIGTGTQANITGRTKGPAIITLTNKAGRIANVNVNVAD